MVDCGRRRKHDRPHRSSLGKPRSPGIKHIPCTYMHSRHISTAGEQQVNDAQVTTCTCNPQWCCSIDLQGPKRRAQGRAFTDSQFVRQAVQAAPLTATNSMPSVLFAIMVLTASSSPPAHAMYSGEVG